MPVQYMTQMICEAPFKAGVEKRVLACRDLHCMVRMQDLTPDYYEVAYACVVCMQRGGTQRPITETQLIHELLLFIIVTFMRALYVCSVEEPNAR